MIPKAGTRFFRTALSATGRFSDQRRASMLFLWRSHRERGYFITVSKDLQRKTGVPVKKPERLFSEKKH